VAIAHIENIFANVSQLFTKAALTRTSRDSQILNANVQNAYEMIVTDIISSMHARFGNLALSHHVRSQLTLLNQRSRSFNRSDIIVMPEDQYQVMQILGMYLGSSEERKWPYFFLTGPAGTGKTYVTRMILNMLDQKREKYLLLAPTGDAAQNIGGRTIHSALRIRGSHRAYLTLAHEDPDLL
jgi:Cdc6-like AAA superfamily ATPase